MNNNRVKHRILALLSKQHLDQYKTGNGSRMGLKIDVLAQKLRVSKQEILELCASLLNENEIKPVDFGESFQGYVALTKGISAYKDKKYLRQNRRDTWESMFNVTKVVVPVILAVIALVTFVININDTKTNSSDIDQIKARLDTLEKRKEKVKDETRDSVGVKTQ